MDKIVIATHNPAKKERFGQLLSMIVKAVLSLDDLGIKEKPFESGETAEDNAGIKARFYADKTGLPVLSEDEALYLDFLPQESQPGVHVRRIGGRDEVDDDRLLAYWQEIVSRVPDKKRTGRWHIAYCLATPEGKVKTASLDHPIVFFSPPSRIRVPGWPISSLQGPIGFNKPHSELTDSERRAHNQKADELIKEKLKELLA
ncbi:MAG: non-canonical purine NTP pyrophosphatase [bacterium]|nr:non-canonical purine NTP pyrophosphatase [bacterium]